MQSLLKSLSTILFLANIFFTYGQSYIPTIGGDNDWYVVWRSSEIDLNRLYFTGSETFIGGEKYVSLYVEKDSLTFLGYLKEDSLSQRIYFYNYDNQSNPNLNTEILLYDFSLTQGDTVYVSSPSSPSDPGTPSIQHTLVVDSIGDYNILVDDLTFFGLIPFINDSARVINLHSLSTNHQDEITWVAGIGSLAGPLRNGVEAGLSTQYELSCFYRDSLLSYKAVSTEVFGLSGCLYESVGLAPQLNKRINIYPNPSSGTLRIEVSNGAKKIERLEVYNINSELVFLDKDYVENGEGIDLNFLTNGVYLIRIQIEGQNLTKRMIINQ